MFYLLAFDTIALIAIFMHVISGYQKLGTDDIIALIVFGIVISIHLNVLLNNW